MICSTSKDLPSFTRRNNRVRRSTRKTVKFAVVMYNEDSTTKGMITSERGASAAQRCGFREFSGFPQLSFKKVDEVHGLYDKEHQTDKARWSIVHLDKPLLSSFCILQGELREVSPRYTCCNPQAN